jgi:hypothetical protein
MSTYSPAQDTTTAGAASGHTPGDDVNWTGFDDEATYDVEAS